MSHVELPWFDGCPGHERARLLIDEVIADIAPATIVDEV